MQNNYFTLFLKTIRHIISVFFGLKCQISDQYQSYFSRSQLQIDLCLYIVYLIQMQAQPNDQELLSVSKSFLEDLNYLQGAKIWEDVEDKPVRIQKTIRGDRVVAKSELTINIPFDVVAKFFQEPTFMKKLSDKVAKAEIIYKNQSVNVVHLKMEGIAMVSDRQLVVVYTYSREGNKLYFGNKSCDYPCQAYKDTVRAIAHCGGYIVQKVNETSTKIINIGDIDLSGSIPDFVKNKIAVMRANSLAELEEKIKAAIK